MAHFPLNGTEEIDSLYSPYFSENDTMNIPDNLAPGEMKYYIRPDGDSFPSNVKYFVESCYLFRLGEEDQENLSKRLDRAYDYVAHWDISPGNHSEPSAFAYDVVEDSAVLRDVKAFLFSLDQPYRPLEELEINFSMDSSIAMDGVRLHASQNIYSSE